MVPHRPELDRPEGEGELGLTERRRSRTYRAVGCTTALVLKPCVCFCSIGLSKPTGWLLLGARASPRAASGIPQRHTALSRGGANTCL